MTSALMTTGRFVLIGGLAVVLAARWATAGTPFGGDDTGFLPPTKDVARCENTVLKSHGKAVACILGCHKKRANGAVDEAGEDACERTGPAASSCKGKYDVATGSDSKIDRLCPPCLDATARANFFGAIRERLDALNKNVYCAGTTAWGSDDNDTGFLPPDKTVAKCENTVGKAVGKATQCIVGCHLRRAAGKLADDAAEDDCETGTSKSSCASKYSDATGTKLDAICPSCLDATARGKLFGTVLALLDADNRIEYCASPSGAFLD